MPLVTRPSTRSGAVNFFIAIAVVVTNAISVPAQNASEPEPWLQKEGDWVDDRWSKTDIGWFHSAVLALPGSQVARGLAIRIGENGDAAVAYDLTTVTLRASWTGGFLKFDAGRYGLIAGPKPAGELNLTTRPAPSWIGATVRWRGWHVNGHRAVLDYEVDGARVLESPWSIETNGVRILIRQFEVAANARELRLDCLIKPPGNATSPVGRQGTLFEFDDGKRAEVVAFAAPDIQTGNLYCFDAKSFGALFYPATTPRQAVLLHWSGPSAQLPAAVTAMKDLKPWRELQSLVQPGPTRWHPLTTRGQPGIGADAYVIDTLTVPHDNPWKALFFTSGVDFLPNGDAAVCTIHGDVWLVSGIDAKLEKLTWRRYATGLNQPLGLRVRDGNIFVLGRDQITRLHDMNGDGEADFYECFSQQIQTSTGGHDYVAALEIDRAGNFYYADPKGVHRITPDGSKRETIAAGWRNPNGMGVSPDGRIITVAPQEGNWTPSSSICEARPGGWYGYPGPRTSAERPLGYDAPLCWIPHSVDNSSGSQLWAPPGWGPLSGQMLHFSFGRCAWFTTLREVVDGMPQGGVVSLPGRFLSGAMRGAFNPKDGQLYVVGSRGWQTSALRDGCLQRVRFTGKKFHVPVELHAHANGLRITFSEPLDPVAANDPGSYGVSQWNYRYAEAYGSKDWSVRQPSRAGRDDVDVKSARLLPDGRTVFLEIPGLVPVMQMRVRYSLRSAEGGPVRSEFHNTINRIGPAWTLAASTP